MTARETPEAIAERIIQNEVESLEAAIWMRETGNAARTTLGVAIVTAIKKERGNE